VLDEILVGVIAGFVGGFAAGLLGVGGGVIYVPAIVLLLDRPQHLAQGVSLGAIIAAALVGGMTHLRRRNVDVATAAGVAPVAVLAGFGGAMLASVLDAELLRRIFAVIVLYFGVSMIVGVLRGERATQEVGG